MKIDYNILWIEDNNNWYEETKAPIEDILLDAGFNIQPTQISTIGELYELIKNDGLRIFDLLLVDFKLSNNHNKNGDAIIQLIRSKDIYTDIIFNSIKYCP